MIKVQVEGQTYVLPEDVYLQPETVRTSDEGRRVEGMCLFPSQTDPRIGDRQKCVQPHVNITSLLDVVWSCAHISGRKVGWHSPLALKTEVDALKITPADTQIRFDARITKLHKAGNKFFGSAKAEFFLGDDKLAEVHVHRFIAAAL